MLGVESLLKTCYWFSKDFAYDVVHKGPDRSTVQLKPKFVDVTSLDEVREEFRSLFGPTSQ